MIMLRSTHLREIAELKARIALLEFDLKQYSVSETNLSGIIRNIDQLIYRMGQCLDWESMRPIFNQLQHESAQRQKLESNLLANAIVARLKKEVNQ